MFLSQPDVLTNAVLDFVIETLITSIRAPVLVHRPRRRCSGSTFFSEEDYCAAISVYIGSAETLHHVPLEPTSCLNRLAGLDSRSDSLEDILVPS